MMLIYYKYDEAVDYEEDILEFANKCELNEMSVDQIRDLINYLLSTVINVISGYNKKNAPNWFSRFFSKLVKLNDSGLFFDFCVLNYDTWVERTGIDFKDGFETVYKKDTENKIKENYRIFNKNEAKTIGDWNTLCHPHGCINYGGIPDNNDGGDGDLCMWDKPIITSSRIKQYVDQNGRHILSPIVTGRKKWRNFEYEPFKTYMENVNGALSYNETIIIIGYSFGDDHINEMIRKYKNDSSKMMIVISPDNIDEIFKGYHFYGLRDYDKVYITNEGNFLWYNMKFKNVATNDDLVEKLCQLLLNHSLSNSCR